MATLNYDSISQQNMQIQTELDNVKSYQDTYNQRDHYHNDNVIFIKNVGSYLWLIYYFLAVILLGVIIFLDKKTGLVVKISILFAIFVFPHIANAIERLIYSFFSYIYKFYYFLNIYRAV